MLTFGEFYEDQDHIPVKIKQHPKRPSEFSAYHKGKLVGRAIHWKDLNHGMPSIFNTEVKAEYRKKGVASQLYKHIEHHLGHELHPATALSDDGHAFWSKYRPEAVKNDLRNHRSKLVGKEIEHPKYGKANIRSVGSNGVTADMHKPNANGSHFYMSRKELESHGHTF